MLYYYMRKTKRGKTHSESLFRKPDICCYTNFKKKTKHRFLLPFSKFIDKYNTNQVKSVGPVFCTTFFRMERFDYFTEDA